MKILNLHACCQTETAGNRKFPNISSNKDIKLKTPYFEKSLQASLSLNHVVSKTAKPPLRFLSSLFSQSVDTTGRSSCEEDIVMKLWIKEQTSLFYYIHDEINKAFIDPRTANLTGRVGEGGGGVGMRSKER